MKILLARFNHSIYSLRKLTGLSPATIWNYLSGNLVKPNPEYVEKIAHALGISSEKLIRLTRLSDDEITHEILHKVILSFAEAQDDIAQAQRDEEKIQSSPSIMTVTQKRRVCKWKLQKRN
jgi:transcriptional regulator with XRE-family HTH domain